MMFRVNAHLRRPRGRPWRRRPWRRRSRRTRRRTPTASPARPAALPRAPGPGCSAGARSPAKQPRRSLGDTNGAASGRGSWTLRTKALCHLANFNKDSCKYETRHADKTKSVPCRPLHVRTAVGGLHVMMQSCALCCNAEAVVCSSGDVERLERVSASAQGQPARLWLPSPCRTGT